MLVICRKLRSADAAFELLDTFSGIESRGTVAAAMLHKESDILAQFAREVLNPKLCNSHTRVHGYII